MTRVYISSSRLDLHQERTEVAKWLNDNGYEAVDSYGPSSKPLVQTCLDDVAGCDLVVLLLGYRRGYVPTKDNPEQLSITRLEFRHALKRKIPVVPLLITRPDAKASDLLNPDEMAHVKAFHYEVSQERVPGEFADLEELRRQLARGVEDELAERGQRLPANGIAAQFQRASRDLLSWPTTLPDGEWLEPPELAQWQSRFAHDRHSTTLLLGEPGCGKSALLARLGNMLAEQDVTVLGIKADLLPPETKDTKTLAQSLGLANTVEALVRRLASEQPVVVLIDQLDAVADLVVQRPERLRVLLDLIQDLSGIINVHVLASCRSFERTHDRTLRNLDLEEITLQLPAWETVASVLLAHGVNTGAWSDEMRETVRSPHALNAFLQLLPGTAEPDLAHGIHGLLEQQWQKHVIEADPTGRRKRVMMALATGMAEEEALWLPTARLDDEFEALQALLREGLLLIPEGEGRVGFRHQTWFEFLRGRSFLERTGLLAETVLASQDCLRIRPQLWHALLYLRRVAPAQYAKELISLWGNDSLRRHLRMLLIAFMGMQKAPLPFEEQIAWGNFDDSWFQPRFLGAVMGSEGWFRALLPAHLPLLMQQSAKESDLTRALLDAVAAAQPDEVLALVDQYWLPRPDMDDQSWTLLVRSNALPANSPWLERLERIAARSPISDWDINEAVSMASAELPERAPHLLKVWLEQRWLEISRQEDAAEALRKLLESNRLHDLPAVAKAAPAAYLIALWPLLAIFFAVDVRSDEIHIVRYRHSGGYLDPWGDERFRELAEFLNSLRVAVEAWGEIAPTELCAFVKEHEQSELLLLHRLLAMGLAKAAPREPAAALDYLLADPRRLSLGNLVDAHRESRLLIAQLVPHLDADQLARLEQAISSLNVYRNASDDDAETRWARRRWNREHRMHLFHAFPVQQRSPAMNKMLSESKPAHLAVERDNDEGGGMHVIGSPVSAEQMAKAGVEEILGLFAELTDETGWDHPRHFMKGGAIQAGRELARLLDIDKGKALSVVRLLDPQRNATPSACVVQELKKAGIPPEAALELINELVDKGFESSSFRSAVGYAIEDLSNEGVEVPVALISRLMAWLEPAEHDSEGFERTERQSQQESQLWGYGASMPLPDGNFPLLIALSRYFLTRRPIAYEQWLDVLEGHLKRSESPRVWEAIGRRYFSCLRGANHGRAQAFLSTLFRSYPSILGDTGCIRAVCDLFRWIEPSYAQEWRNLMAAQGAPGQIGSAELLLLRHVWWPQERWVTDAIEEIIISTDPERLLQRVGLAHTVAQLWNETPLRELVKSYLLRLMSSNEKPVLRALARIFRMDAPWLPDAHTREVLDALAASPAIFRSSDGEFAVEVMEHLVRYEPNRVYQVTTALIDTVADELANTATSWAYRSDALVSIALVLQDKGAEHSAQGATLFERLLEFNVPAATEAAQKLDRRTPNAQSRQRARRRRFR